MKKKRIMIIGARGSGKTSIANILNGISKTPARCQDVIYGKNTIDIPSAYIENSWMYKNMIALSQDASHILIVVKNSHKDDIYSEGFAKVFTKPVIGIINKEDFEHLQEKAISTLKSIKVEEPYFIVNAKSGEGIEELKSYLKYDERG